MSVTLVRAIKAPSVQSACFTRARIVSIPPWRAFATNGRRAISTSPHRAIAVSEMKKDDLSSLRVNQDRLMNDIHTTCEWGKGERWGDAETETGMSRLSLSDSDKEARDWFHKTCTEFGCKVHTDTMGNQFAIRPGLTNDAPPTYAGSHLDTQPTGGRY
ncbi:hypothetical protein KC365_g16995, partial [Hortaea werneckii]